MINERASHCWDTSQKWCFWEKTKTARWTILHEQFDRIFRIYQEHNNA